VIPGSTDREIPFGEVLGRLGRATGVSRIHVFRNRTGEITVALPVADPTAAGSPDGEDAPIETLSDPAARPDDPPLDLLAKPFTQKALLEGVRQRIREGREESRGYRLRRKPRTAGTGAWRRPSTGR